MKITTVLVVATTGMSTMATAQTERDLGSHEHGSASLNIAIDDSAVFLELETPWNNFVGFEHAPRTDEQHTMIDATLAQLNQPEQLFTFVGSECTLAETTLENGLAEDEHHDDEHHEDEHHDEEGHDDEHHGEDGHDEHAEEEHDEEEHAHDEHADEASEHSSVLVMYTFNCADAPQISTIDVKLLEIWSGFEDLDVQLIGPGGQASLELSPQQIQVDVSQVQ